MSTRTGPLFLGRIDAMYRRAVQQVVRSESQTLDDSNETVQVQARQEAMRRIQRADALIRDTNVKGMTMDMVQKYKRRSIIARWQTRSHITQSSSVSDLCTYCTAASPPMTLFFLLHYWWTPPLFSVWEHFQQYLPSTTSDGSSASISEV